MIPLDIPGIEFAPTPEDALTDEANNPNNPNNVLSLGSVTDSGLSSDSLQSEGSEHLSPTNKNKFENNLNTVTEDTASGNNPDSSARTEQEVEMNVNNLSNPSVGGSSDWDASFHDSMYQEDEEDVDEDEKDATPDTSAVAEDDTSLSTKAQPEQEGENEEATAAEDMGAKEEANLTPSQTELEPEIAQDLGDSDKSTNNTEEKKESSDRFQLAKLSKQDKSDLVDSLTNSLFKDLLAPGPNKPEEAVEVEKVIPVTEVTDVSSKDGPIVALEIEELSPAVDSTGHEQATDSAKTENDRDVGPEHQRKPKKELRNIGTFDNDNPNKY